MHKPSKKRRVNFFLRRMLETRNLFFFSFLPYKLDGRTKKTGRWRAEMGVVSR